MQNQYCIIPTDEAEIPFLRYVQETKDINGYVHPNLPGGTLFKLTMDDELASLLKLKFTFILFGRSVTQP